MREADARVVELDDAFADGRLEPPEDTFPVSVRRRDHVRHWAAPSAATWSRTSSVSPGRRARRPPSSSRRLSGTRRAWPGAGRAPVRTSSRPSSSAKNGLPAVASCTRPSSGRDSSKPSRCLSRLCVALRLSGPTGTSTKVIVGEGARELERGGGLASYAQGGRGRRARRAGAAARAERPEPRRESSHCRSSRATSTGPRSASSLSTSRKARPIAAASGGCSPGSASQSATSSARRRGGERGNTSPSNGNEEIGEPAEGKQGLGLDAAVDQNTAESLFGLLDTGLPEDRLADPRLSGEHKRRRAALDVAQERLDRGKLLVAPDDLPGHRGHNSARTAASPRREARRGARRASRTHARDASPPCSRP